MELRGLEPAPKVLYMQYFSALRDDSINFRINQLLFKIKGFHFKVNRVATQNATCHFGEIEILPLGLALGSKFLIFAEFYIIFIAFIIC